MLRSVLWCRLLRLLVSSCLPPSLFFFFFNDTATTEIYTLSLHDALPISAAALEPRHQPVAVDRPDLHPGAVRLDRKSTRLNSSHLVISYAVFCLKKKKKTVPKTVGRTYRTQLSLQPPSPDTASCYFTRPL